VIFRRTFFWRVWSKNLRTAAAYASGAMVMPSCASSSSTLIQVSGIDATGASQARGWSARHKRAGPRLIIEGQCGNGHPAFSMADILACLREYGIAQVRFY
jgi:hypothetical protein